MNNDIYNTNQIRKIIRNRYFYNPYCANWEDILVEIIDVENLLAELKEKELITIYIASCIGYTVYDISEYFRTNIRVISDCWERISIFLMELQRNNKKEDYFIKAIENILQYLLTGETILRSSRRTCRICGKWIPIPNGKSLMAYLNICSLGCKEIYLKKQNIKLEKEKQYLTNWLADWYKKTRKNNPEYIKNKKEYDKGRWQLMNQEKRRLIYDNHNRRLREIKIIS